MNDLITLEDYKADFEFYNQQLLQLESESKRDRTPNTHAIDALLKSDWKLIYAKSTREEKQKFWRQIVKEIRIFKNRRIEFDFNV